MSKIIASKKEPYKSFSGFGIDVASKRADDLDRFSLDHLGSKNSAKVLDIGCGVGGHSLRMAEIGADVVAIDKYDFSHDFIKYNKELNNKLRFIKGDIRELQDLVAGEVFTDAVMQRTLHYLTFAEAKKVLTQLNEIVKDKLFISVTGIDSGVGEDYQGKGVEVENRFFTLDDTKSETFSIHEPVCLYTESEFIDLLEETGWKVERCWKSAFGNIKAICQK